MRAARSIGRDPQPHHHAQKEQPQQQKHQQHQQQHDVQQEQGQEQQAEVPIIMADTADVNVEPKSATTSNAFLEALVRNVESEPELWLPSGESNSSLMPFSPLATSAVG